MTGRMRDPLDKITRITRLGARDVRAGQIAGSAPIVPLCGWLGLRLRAGFPVLAGRWEPNVVAPASVVENRRRAEFPGCLGRGRLVAIGDRPAAAPPEDG